MGKLIFMHGVMDSGKSSMLIQKAYQFDQKSMTVCVLKPCLDSRSPSGKVKSDIGIEWPCIDVECDVHLEGLLGYHELEDDVQVILVDEAQFLQEYQVDELAAIADANNVLVIAFGLKTDFTGHLFRASKRLIELADRVDEIPSMCACGHKATHHVILKAPEGTNIMIGDDSIYTSCCRKCFMNSKKG